MKFPKKLSKERLSLLSKEDRKIYEYEHSGLYTHDSLYLKEPIYNSVNESDILTDDEKQFILENDKRIFNT